MQIFGSSLSHVKSYEGKNMIFLNLYTYRLIFSVLYGGCKIFHMKLIYYLKTLLISSVGYSEKVDSEDYAKEFNNLIDGMYEVESWFDGKKLILHHLLVVVGFFIREKL